MYLQSNTGNKIARIRRDQPSASPEEIARAVWPKTQQVEKKARTVRKYLRGFQRETADNEWPNAAFYGYPRLAVELKPEQEG